MFFFSHFLKNVNSTKKKRLNNELMDLWLKSIFFGVWISNLIYSMSLAVILKGGKINAVQNEGWLQRYPTHKCPMCSLVDWGGKLGNQKVNVMS